MEKQLVVHQSILIKKYRDFEKKINEKEILQWYEIIEIDKEWWEVKGMNIKKDTIK